MKIPIDAPIDKNINFVDIPNPVHRTPHIAPLRIFYHNPSLNLPNTYFICKLKKYNAKLPPMQTKLYHVCTFI